MSTLGFFRNTAQNRILNIVTVLIFIDIDFLVSVGFFFCDFAWYRISFLIIMIDQKIQRKMFHIIKIHDIFIFLFLIVACHKFSCQIDQASKRTFHPF